MRKSSTPKALFPAIANSNADYRLKPESLTKLSHTLAKGEAVATNKNSYSTTTTSTHRNRSGTSASTKRSYFGTDDGSVRSSTHDDGLNANYYDYDVFGNHLARPTTTATLENPTTQ